MRLRQFTLVVEWGLSKLGNVSRWHMLTCCRFQRTPRTSRIGRADSSLREKSCPCRHAIARSICTIYPFNRQSIGSSHDHKALISSCSVAAFFTRSTISCWLCNRFVWSMTTTRFCCPWSSIWIAAAVFHHIQAFVELWTLHRQHRYPPAKGKSARCVLRSTSTNTSFNVVIPRSIKPSVPLAIHLLNK